LPVWAGSAWPKNPAVRKWRKIGISEDSRIKSALRKLHWFLSAQLGLDPLAFLRALVALPRYLRDLARFRFQYRGRLGVVPCLHDRLATNGLISNEYFWQDLQVARWIFAASPVRHLDIGSRVDGFVAHVASFRQVEVVDIRPAATEIPGVTFVQADIMDSAAVEKIGGESCDSISCLHALEHFGLGRYGDPLNPEGYKVGLQNMAKLLSPGGVFYLSTPIGNKRVEFNANWVFDPGEIIDYCVGHGLDLFDMHVFTGRSVDRVQADGDALEHLRTGEYCLGIFRFRKAVLQG
jgi:SAM-dependent methyltransferase